jgi:hypothetical protein
MTFRRSLVRVLLALGNFHCRMLALYFVLLGPRGAYAVTGIWPASATGS